MEEQNQKTEEPRIRMNKKQNFKGEYGYEITVRADTIQEAKELLEQAWLELTK